MTPPSSAEAWPADRVIVAARDGDREALATLVAQSHPHVRRFAGSLCATPEEAEDAAQEAMLILYRQIGTLRATAALASWMFRIVRNACLRELMRRPAVHHTRAVDAPSAEATALAQLESDRIIAAIAALPAEQRAVLVLRDILGLSGAETAERLALSTPAMKARLHRARTAVRAQL